MPYIESLCPNTEIAKYNDIHNFISSWDQANKDFNNLIKSRAYQLMDLDNYDRFPVLRDDSWEAQYESMIKEHEDTKEYIKKAEQEYFESLEK